MAKIQSINSVAGKETIYVDVDDEITAIIDKVTAAKGKVIALVLPKRCAVLQSVVNMKLLKRTAESSGKNLVLVTSEAGLMPLAGAIGMFVASSPTSKPAVPDAPDVPSNEPEDIDEPLNVVDGNAGEGDEDFDTDASAEKSIGELAAAGAAGKLAADDIDESIELGDDDEDNGEATEALAAKTPKAKKNKDLKVPNFNRFRMLIVLGIIALIILIGGLIFALTVLPKATVTIHTDTSDISTNLGLALSTTATSLDPVNDVVPATSQSKTTMQSETVPATGQQNNGQKATGTVTVTNCTTNNSEVTMPAGSTISSGNNTYVLDSTVDLLFSGVHGNKPCQSGGVASTNVNITALNAGSASNTSSQNTSFTSSSEGNNVEISGGASGGTDNIITVVQQSDITNATNKANAASTGNIKQELEQAIEGRGLMPIPVTYLAGSPQTSSNVPVGTQASSVTVTVTNTYTMMGVQKSDLQTLVDNNVNGQIDKGKQVILSDGVATAQFGEANQGTPTNAQVAMTAISVAGPQINTTTLKKQLGGMEAGSAENYIKQTPGVTSVTVKLSPFWVTSVPKNTSKVTINLEKARS